ncbi:uncharacterized protein TrAFT101_010675 [Trichoderma asperellum]|uniref:uncharacterized protein n=1 Tax=Trichoderma asperellum TaxID=101201 RepID=UPI003333B0F0|nr:hypothetical protein TrAFT101_010675 [Trichoderma asperellum]
MTLHLASANSRDNILRLALLSTQSIPCAQPQFGDKRAHALRPLVCHARICSVMGWIALAPDQLDDERSCTTATQAVGGWGQ